MVAIQIYPSKLQTLVSSTLAFPLFPHASFPSLSPLFCATKSLQNPQKRERGRAWNFERIGATRETKCRKLPLDPILSSLSLYRSYRSFLSNRTHVWGKGEEIASARSDRRFTRVINRSSYIAHSKNLGETRSNISRFTLISVRFFFFFFFWSLVAVIHRGTIWIKISKTDGAFKRDDFYYFYEGREEDLSSKQF